MASAKLIAVLAIVVIIVLGLLVSNLIPGFRLPQKAQIISEGPVALSPGGSIQNGYVVHTNWAVTFTLNSLQSFVFSLNAQGANDSGLSGNTINGATVVPTSQLYVQVTPLQPYAYVPLSCSNSQYAPEATGYGSPISGQTFATPGPLEATQVTSNPQDLKVCTPTTTSWISVYPVRISVTQLTGNSSFAWPSETFFTTGPNAVNTAFLKDPQNPNLEIQVNNLGDFAGSRSPPQLNDPAFFQGTSGGSSQWYGYDSGTLGISNFANYWFGPNTGDQFSSQGGQSNFGSNYWANGVCDSSVHPGWEQLYVGFNQPPQSGTYWYAPITPSISTSIGGNYSNQNYGYDESGLSTGEIITQICNDNAQLPMSLNGYLGYAGYSSYDFTPFASAGVSGYSINSSMLVQDLPMPSLSGVAIPTMQFQFPAELLNTVIYQVNNAQFKISSFSPSSSSVESGSVVSFSGSIQDASSIPGTASLYLSQNATLLGITPVAPITFSSGDSSQPFSFDLSALYVKQVSADTLTFCVGNDAGQITDCKSAVVTITPQPTNGYVNLVIEKITAPSSVQVGHDGSVSVAIKDLGISGTAFLNATSEATTVAAISPLEQNQSIGSGQTIDMPFIVTGLSTNSTQTVSFIITLSNGTRSSSQSFSVNVTASGPICIMSCNPNVLPWYEIWTSWLAIGVLGLMAVSGFILYRRHA